MNTKKEIRHLVRERRNQIPAEEEENNSRKISELLLSLPEYRKAEAVFCYVDCRHEVHTRSFILQAIADGKKAAVPKVRGKNMEFYYITSLRDLEPGYFGILEPKEGLSVAMDKNAFFVMPGVAFDRDHHRVGYGGGFYDRYLSTHPGLVTAAIAFDCQVFEKVPFEVFDIRPSVLITEKGISRLKEE